MEECIYCSEESYYRDGLYICPNCLRIYTKDLKEEYENLEPAEKVWFRMKKLLNMQYKVRVLTLQVRILETTPK